ncbi:MAG: Gfo/Idh/MocA family oxidoreductase [Candidatus Omnitrophica bacterium]|nr:Gfo/Idh/MocA family oxidoreductase [Candidatus Omnitrophota bacterium]
MAKKIKIGLIGAGAVASKHLDVIKAIDWIEAVGITSRTISKAEKLAQEYGISFCTEDIDYLIEQSKPDALMVLVSADQIYPVALNLISYGLPLFIEKPAGLTPDEAKNLAELAKKHSLATMVGYNRRYYSVFHKGLEIIRKHGPLFGVFIEGHERMWLRADKLSENMRSQWIFSNGTHTIDLLRFFGGEVTNLQSMAHRYIESRGDQFAAVMELASGAIGQYCAHWYSPGGWRVVLYGQGATVEFKPLESGQWTDKEFKTYSIEPDKVDTEYKPGFFRQMEAFGGLVAEGKFQWPMLDLEGAYKTMTLAEGLSSNVSDKNLVLEK